MEEESKIPLKARLFKTEIIVAFAAILISVMTLFVYIYQARIMQEQQHASIWPYIEWDMTLSTSEGFYISIVNKGVGPAIIHSTSLELDGELMSDQLEYLTKLIDNLDSMSLFYTAIDNRVIGPGEEIRLFHVNNGVIGNKLLADKVFTRTKYEICFCSIYGDCWTSKGLSVVEDTCN